MAWTTTSLGSGQSKTSGTTVATSTGVSASSGDTLILCVAYDNLTASTPTISSINRASGETATWSTYNFDSPVATAAGGAKGSVSILTTTQAWSNVTITVTLTGTVTAKTIAVFSVTGGTVGTPSTTAMSLASGDWFAAFSYHEGEAGTAPTNLTVNSSNQSGTSSIDITTTGGGNASNITGNVRWLGSTGAANAGTVGMAGTVSDGGTVYIPATASTGPAILQCSGTSAATAGGAGAPTSSQQVTGTTASTTVASGAPYSRQQITGTSAATSSVSGDTTIYSTIKQTSGTVAVVAGSSAAPTSTQLVSGTSTATTVVSGAPIIYGSLVEVRRNLMRNPTASVNATDYGVNAGSGGIAGTVSRVAADTSLSVEGRDLSYARLTLTSVTTPGSFAQSGMTMGQAAGDGIRLVDSTAWGLTLTFSAYARDSAATRTARLWMKFFNDSSGQQGGNFLGSTVSIAGSWTRLSVSATIPTNTTRVFLVLEGQSGTNWAVDETIDVGGVLAEIAGSALTYFDGDTTDAGGYDYQWTGTAGASHSVILAVPQIYQVSGTSPATATSSGAPGAIQQVSGTSACTTTLTGAPYDKAPAAGTSTATTTVSGAPYDVAPAAGVSTATSTTSGAPVIAAVSYAVDGTVTLSTTSSGAPISRQQLSGTSALSTTVSGNPYDKAPAAGTSAATVSVSGAVTSKQLVSGISALSTTVIGAVSKVIPGAAGIIPVTSTTPAANPTITTGPTTYQVTGVVVVTTTTPGAPTSRQRVSSTSAAVVITVGSVNLISGTQQVSGTISVTALTSGTARMRGAGTGTISVSAATSAAPTSRQRVSATTAAMATTSGGPSIYGSVTNGYWGIRL